jgi:methyl-accepting chemotaxis protein
MLMPPHFRKQHSGQLRNYVQTGQSHILGKDLVLEGQTKKGKQFPLSLRVTEMTYRNQRMFLGVLQDITERKQAEDERARLFKAIRETANQLSTTSMEISTSLVHNTEGSERQVQVVTQTAAAVDQTERTAEESAMLATDVAETTRDADAVGKSGRQAIEETRNSIDTVRAHVASSVLRFQTLVGHAQQIGAIITTVNDIAEQTSVLALNAAIEASRAGDAGRGFAVVAAEVKSLAAQAKNATDQVRDILIKIQSATQEAAESAIKGADAMGEAEAIVTQADQTINELARMVAAAAQAVANIAAASRQQAASMSQIKHSMTDVDKTAKQTLAATRQTENALHDLNAMGSRLKELLATEAIHFGKDGR